MKFTGPLSTLLVVLPSLVLQGSAAPFNFGGKGGGIFGKDRNGNNSGAAAAGAANSTAAAGAANSTAAAGASNAAGAAAGAANSTAAAGASNAAGAAAGAANATAAAGGDPQTSFTLDPKVVCTNCAQTGQQGAGTTAGQVASETSTNNFINTCLGKTITNGLQVATGSCNPIPMGDTVPRASQPSCKFQVPVNMQNFAENTAFTVNMAIVNMVTGNFVNPNTNFFAAPQRVDATGKVIGHSHIVIQSIPSITSTTPADPTIFAFFQGLNNPASNGVLSANVAKGLPAGTYRIGTLNTAANHQPVLGAVAQHGIYDDAVYFTVGPAAAAAAAAAVGGAANNGTAAAAAPPAAAPPAAANATAAAPPAAANATAAAPPAAVNATAAAPPAAGGAGKGKGKGKGKGGRRSFMIARQN